MQILRVLKRRQTQVCPQSVEDTYLCPPEATREIKVMRKDSYRLERCSTAHFYEIFGVTYLPRVVFKDSDTLGLARSLCPLGFRFAYYGMERDRLYNYYRHQIMQGTVADVTVGWVNDYLEYGLYANTSLEKGAYIGAYTGIVRLMSQVNPDHNVYCLRYPTTMLSRRVLAVDASLYGNEMRFANHSDEPNMSLECLYDRGVLLFFLRANQPISKGTQLTFDYGEDFWRERVKLRVGEPSLEGLPLW
jgi:hypothetical protein